MSFNKLHKCLIPLTILIALIGCEVEFSEEETKIWLNYRQGEDLIFENQFGIKDTISIIEKEIENIGWRPPFGPDETSTGRFNPKRGIVWACMGNEINRMTRECKTVFIKLYKESNNEPALISISFPGIYTTFSTDTLEFYEDYEDTLLSRTYSNIYLIYNYSENLLLRKPLDIDRYIWNSNKGLIRYDKFNGEVWERINY